MNSEEIIGMNSEEVSRGGRIGPALPEGIMSDPGGERDMNSCSAKMTIALYLFQSVPFMLNIG